MEAERVHSNFSDMRTQLLEEVNRSYIDGDAGNIKIKLASFDAKESEKRAALEQALRDKLVSLLYGSTKEPRVFSDFMDLVMTLCKQEMTVTVLSISLLSDIFDSSTIPVCKTLFGFVEAHVTTWKSPLFFNSCKNNILRMCNGLLRRLSKGQNTVFCGRILLFLAMFFPFSERSGLNLVSEFNVDKDNFMKCEMDLDELEEEPMQTADIPIKLDSNFYSEFWSIQEYFRSPNLCSNKSQWKEFVKNSNAVLTVFKNFKLEWDANSDDLRPNTVFFTKFLTNQKLLLLQLSDSEFRRTIYLQFLILFQFLSAQVKTKDSYDLTPEQLEWVKESTSTVKQLIKESPPNGEKFLECVELILKREEHWSLWKHEGCPALKKVMPDYKEVKPPPAKPTATVAEILIKNKAFNKLVLPKGDSCEVLDMRQDYLQYLPGRNCSPSLNEYLAEAIQQSETTELIEDKDKKVNDPQFAWIALKLLSLKSPHFFSVNHNPIPKLPEFIDHICRRLFREQNPGMCLPPLMPAPKPVTKSDPKKSVVKSQKTSLKAVKTSKGTVKLAKTSTVETVKESSNSKPPVVLDKPEPKPDKGKPNDKSYEKSDKYERYDKSKNDKPPVKTTVKTVEKTKDRVEKKVEVKRVEKDKLVRKDSKDKSPAKRKRENEVERDLSPTLIKKSKDKRDDRKDDDDDYPVALTKDVISRLAKSISGSWKKVAEKLGFKSEEIECLELIEGSDQDRAVKLLLNWTNEEDATPENLRHCLKNLGLSESAKILSSF